MDDLLDRPILSRPDDTDLDALIRVRGLCVSIVVNTTPTTRMSDVDRYRLHSHAMDALRRLELESDRALAAAVSHRIETAVEEAGAGPTDTAVALFVTRGSSRILHLPVAVEDRVVVDPTFATRDVVRAVQSNPRFLLLHMDHRGANLFLYNQKYLQPVLSSHFPALREGRVRAGRHPEQHRSFLRAVDAGLSRHLADTPLPVVLVGGHRVLGEFLGLTRNGARVAGIARGIHARPSLALLEGIGRSTIGEHVADLAAAAEDTLHARLHGERAVTGLLGCWHAAATGSPELLVVEERFSLPARSVAGGRYVEPVADAEHPDVIDDAVDDLIEKVLVSGGHVSLVPDGTLRHHGRVAMTLAG